MSKLFLAAEAKNPNSLKRLKKFVGGSFKNKKIAYVPTAANGEYYGAWKGTNSIKVAMSLEAKINIVELESDSYRNISKEIKGSDILWMAGGMSGYLLYWIRRTELDKALPDILEKGTIYVGSSAGSMVCTTTSHVAEWFLGEPEPGSHLLPGLGLVDFEIYPHYEDHLKPEIEKRWNKGQGKLYCLRNEDVITKVDDKLEVLGEEIIIKK